MTLRAVFFDLDDTLCDTIGTREARARRAFEVLCAVRPELDLGELIERAMEPVGERVVRGVPQTAEELGLAETPAGREAMGIWFFEGCYGLLKPLPGVVETVDRLRENYVLGIGTNGDAKLQRAKCTHLTLGIDRIIISAECGFEKPDARIFNRALESAGVSADEAAFVGDRLDVDVAGAKAAGIRAVWFNPSAALRTSDWGGALDGASPQPDAVIGRFDELPAVLERL